MRNNWYKEMALPQEEVIACFGKAYVVRNAEGRIEIRGGSEYDRESAQNWCDYFLRDASVTLPGTPT